MIFPWYAVERKFGFHGTYREIDRFPDWLDAQFYATCRMRLYNRYIWRVVEVFPPWGEIIKPFERPLHCRRRFAAVPDIDRASSHPQVLFTPSLEEATEHARKQSVGTGLAWRVYRISPGGQWSPLHQRFRCGEQLVGWAA